MINNLPDADTLDGTELIAIYQGGIECKVALYKVLLLAPPTLTATPTAFGTPVIANNLIDLEWTSAATNFILERCRDNDNSWVQIYSGATNSFSDTGLYPETHYYYRVSAQSAGNFDSEYAYVDATTTAV